MRPQQAYVHSCARAHKQRASVRACPAAPALSTSSAVVAAVRVPERLLQNGRRAEAAHAAPPVLLALEGEDREARQRAARVLGLLVQRAPECVPDLLQQFAVASLVKLLQRDSLAGAHSGACWLYTSQLCALSEM